MIFCGFFADCLLDFTLASGLFAGLFAGFYFAERIVCWIVCWIFTLASGFFADCLLDFLRIFFKNPIFTPECGNTAPQAIILNPKSAGITEK